MADSDASSIEKLSNSLINHVKNRPILTISLILGAIFVWVLRPYFHFIYYPLRYVYIGTVVYLLLTTIFAIGTKYSIKVNRKKIAYVLGVFTVILFMITIASPYIADVYQDEALAERTNANTPETTNFTGAPHVDVNNTRTMTFKGAETQAQSSFNQPTHKLTNGELVMYNGSLATSYAQEPEGVYKTFTRKQRGAVFVNINSQNSEVTEVNQKFECGRGMLIFDNVGYQVQKEHMDTNLKNPTTFQANNGELYNMFSGIQHDVRFGTDNTIPMFYGVPHFSSVHLSDTDCNQEELTPKEAVNDPRMDGENKQQFYPYALVRQEVIATNYQHGWINTLTDEEGMKEFPDTQSIDNRPPFTMMMDDGTYRQVLTMEAIGSGTGVFEIYITNGRTGEKTKYTFESARKGPSFAVNAVITSNSERFAEQGSQESDKLTVSEVYPIVQDGELWYQVNAVQSGTGIYGFTAFYNPESKTLLKAYTDKQIRAFYNGNYETHEQPETVVEPTGEDNDEGRNVENPNLWIVIEDENGDTYTVPVSSGETISVKQESPENSTDS